MAVIFSVGHLNTLTYARQVHRKLQPFGGLERRTDMNEPMVLMPVVFVLNVRDVRVLGVLLGKLADQVLMQAAADTEDEAVIVDEGGADIVDIRWFQIGISDPVRVFRMLDAIRIESFETRTFNVFSVLQGGHPLLHLVERIGEGEVRIKIEVSLRATVRPILRMGIFRPQPRIDVDTLPGYFTGREAGKDGFPVFVIVTEGGEGRPTLLPQAFVPGAVGHADLRAFRADLPGGVLGDVLFIGDVGGGNVIVGGQPVPVSRIPAAAVSGDEIGVPTSRMFAGVIGQHLEGGTLLVVLAHIAHRAGIHVIVGPLTIVPAALVNFWRIGQPAFVRRFHARMITEVFHHRTDGAHGIDGILDVRFGNRVIVVLFRPAAIGIRNGRVGIVPFSGARHVVPESRRNRDITEDAPSVDPGVYGKGGEQTGEGTGDGLTHSRIPLQPVVRPVLEMDVDDASFVVCVAGRIRHGQNLHLFYVL